MKVSSYSQELTFFFINKKEKGVDERKVFTIIYVYTFNYLSSRY